MGLLLALSLSLLGSNPRDATPGTSAPVTVGSWVRVAHWDCGPIEGSWALSIEDPAVCPVSLTQGRVISGDRHQLSLRRRSQEYVVSLTSDRLVRLEVRTGRSPARGAAKGLKRGVLVGLAVAFLACSEGCGDTDRESLRFVGGVVGVSAGVGTTLGVLFGGTRWEGVPLDRRPPSPATLRPARGPGLALRFSF
jgi:hypothetical protein